MNARNGTLLCLFFLMLFCWACEKWNLPRQSFIQVELLTLEELSIDSVRVQGQVKDVLAEQIRDHGFVWTTSLEAPGLFNNEGLISLGVNTTPELSNFVADVALFPNQNYLFRAFATEDGQAIVYSEVQSYKTGNGMVSSLSLDYQRGFELVASGKISETEKGILAIQHGFCWSETEQSPTLANQVVKLGLRRNNEVFTHRIENLKNEIPLFVRAYAVLEFDFRADTVYGEVLKFEGDLNFWSRKADFQGTTTMTGMKGSFFTIGQKVYFKPFLFVTSGVTEKDFWSFDPQNNTWTQLADYEPALRVGEITVGVGDKAYWGLGVDKDRNQLTDWWEYNPNTNTWTQKASFSGTPRDVPLSCSLNGEVYVGTGSFGGSYFKDWWAYNPIQDEWSQKTDFPDTARPAGVAFSIGDKLYYGLGGRRGFLGQRYADLWAYDPQLDTWERKGDFIGGERTDAISLVISDRVFVGMGSNSSQQVDWYEYFTNTDSWVARTDFAGPQRELASSFVIGEKGYVGFGFTTLQSGRTQRLIDLWEFDP